MADFDWSRVGELAVILVTTWCATAARVLGTIVSAQDYPPVDAEGARLWWRRFGWTIAAEISAVVAFVLVAEAIVVSQGYSGPVGVIIGAVAATLGFPFVAGIVRKRVERKVEDNLP
jgi:hypothetical protein